MKFSYNWLKELVNFRESPTGIAELLNLHSFEVETIARVGNDFALDVKIPSNRISDSGNHFGLAKEISAILNLKTKSKKTGNNLDSSKSTKLQLKIRRGRTKPTVQVKIARPELCSRYTAIVLNLGKIGVSPEWMQRRLIACGLRPINIIVDITNYVMLESGQPLHAFDLDKIKGEKLTIRGSKKGEKLTTLDGIEHQLAEGIIVIEDTERLIDLAGIMGGSNSAVSENTKQILLQAATFDPVRIYRATSALNFSSDAAKIYSAGSDPNKTAMALERAVDLLLKIGAVDAPEDFIDIYPQKILPRKISFRPEYADRIIGEPLGLKFYHDVFTKLGFKFKVGKERWTVEVPTERKDLQIEEDLNEEIARLYGYARLRPKLPKSTLVPPPQNDEVWWERRTIDGLVGSGFIESQIYEFSGDKELNQFASDQSSAVALENPMNPETKYLVPRVLIKFMSSAVENLKHFDEIKIFGIAKSFRKEPPYEHKDLIICLAAKNSSKEEGFYQLKGSIDELFDSLGIADHWYDDAIQKKDELWHPHRRAEIKIGEEKIGVIGEIHPAILENLKAKKRISAAEIEFEKLWKNAHAEQEFRPIGKYPAIVRDIAVIVPHNTKTDKVQEIIENIGGKLLVDSDLFDYFQDEQMRESDKKNLAFHLIFQSQERTLVDEEVGVLLDKIIKALEEQEWEVRK